MIELNHEKCTACGACIQKCPKNCIELKRDDNGFLYPSVNTTECIGCGLCDKVCPIGKQLNEAKTPTAYACATAEDNMLIQATSGGIFGAIAIYVLEQGGVVYGCAYTEHLQATHIRIDNQESLSVLFGSKYVQSNTHSTYKECEEDLKSGKQVLYSGTPCQIAGLKNYLQKDYTNLLTVDLVCHGVASQAYFDKFIGLLEKEEGAVCTNYNFRSKRNAGWSVAGLASFETDSGKVFDKKQYYFSNYYYYYYLACSIYRESCYSCEYANLNRVGDFTLGDFWGAEGLDIPFDVEKGCSLVLLNSEKAISLFEKLNLQKHEVSLDIAIKYNKQLQSPSHARYDRNELLREYREEQAATIQQIFKKKNKKQILIGKMKYIIPKGLKRVLLKIKYKK